MTITRVESRVSPFRGLEGATPSLRTCATIIDMLLVASTDAGSSGGIEAFGHRSSPPARGHRHLLAPCSTRPAILAINDDPRGCRCRSDVPTIYRSGSTSPGTRGQGGGLPLYRCSAAARASSAGLRECSDLAATRSGLHRPFFVRATDTSTPRSPCRDHGRGEWRPDVPIWSPRRPMEGPRRSRWPPFDPLAAWLEEPVGPGIRRLAELRAPAAPTRPLDYGTIGSFAPF